MIKYGMDATIVVHEATFEDKMWKEAKMKNHSTTKHAIEMALKYVLTFTEPRNFVLIFSQDESALRVDEPLQSTIP